MGPVVVAYVAVGSNVDPEINVPIALSRLWKSVPVTATSVFYETEPLLPSGHKGPQQAPYANGVWRLECPMDARELKFEVLRSVEESMGRRRGGDRYAERSIDLDLILFGGLVVKERDLQIPHREIWERPFVAAPLLELDPDLVLPGTNERLESLASSHATKEMLPLKELTKILRLIIADREGDKQ